MKVQEVGMGGRNESAMICIDQGRSGGKKTNHMLKILAREVVPK